MIQTTISNAYYFSLTNSDDEATYQVLLYAIDPQTGNTLRYASTDVAMAELGYYQPKDLIGKTLYLDNQNQITDIR